MVLLVENCGESSGDPYRSFLTDNIFKSNNSPAKNYVHRKIAPPTGYRRFPDTGASASGRDRIPEEESRLLYDSLPDFEFEKPDHEGID